VGIPEVGLMEGFLRTSLGGWIDVSGGRKVRCRSCNFESRLDWGGRKISLIWNRWKVSENPRLWTRSRMVSTLSKENSGEQKDATSTSPERK